MVFSLIVLGKENPLSKVIFEKVINKHEKLSKIVIDFANFTVISAIVPILMITFYRIFTSEFHSEDYELPLPVW